MNFKIKLLRHFPDAESLIQSEDFVPNWFLGLATLIAVGSIDYALDDKYIEFQDEETKMFIEDSFPKSMDSWTHDDIAMKTIDGMKDFIEEQCGPAYLPALQREIEAYEESKLQ